MLQACTLLAYLLPHIKHPDMVVWDFKIATGGSRRNPSDCVLLTWAQPCQGPVPQTLRKQQIKAFHGCKDEWS